MISEEKINQIINKTIFQKIGEFTLNEQQIDEALIHSYPTPFVVKHLLYSFPLTNGIMEYIKNKNDYIGWINQQHGNNNCDVIIITLNQHFHKILKDITLSMEKSCGWFLSCNVKCNMNGFEYWQFEKKFDNEVTDEILGQNYLYHLCPTSRLKKIINVGLLPKKTTWTPFKMEENTFYYEQGKNFGWTTIDRVYFFTEEPNIEFLQNNTFNEKNVFTDTYTLLSIDTTQLLPNTKFYTDPRTKNAVYTLDNIPPKAIQIIKKE